MGVCVESYRSTLFLSVCSSAFRHTFVAPSIDCCGAPIDAAFIAPIELVRLPGDTEPPPAAEADLGVPDTLGDPAGLLAPPAPPSWHGFTTET